jgi:hypothetical protein
LKCNFQLAEYEDEGKGMKSHLMMKGWDLERETKTELTSPGNSLHSNYA